MTNTFPFKMGVLWSVVFLFSCSKSTVKPEVEIPVKIVEIKPAIDPELASSIGFFLDEWQPKTYKTPEFIEGTLPSSTTHTVTVDASEIITKIPQKIFGHNANTWMGTFMDSPSFINDVTNLNANVIRWPAGSGSNVYFWNTNPVDDPNVSGFKETPPTEYMEKWGVPKQFMNLEGQLEDAKFFYGQTNDNWRGSLENYYAMLAATGNEGSICVNYSFARYGTTKDPVATAAKLAADWVRHDNGRTKLWEVGNENYGTWEKGNRIDLSKNQDGQPEFLTGELYAKHFKVFADSMRNAAAEIGSQIKIGAVFQESEIQDWQSNTTKTWNEGLVKNIDNQADFYIAHNYITPYDDNTEAAIILKSAIELPEKMMGFIKNEISKHGGQEKPIAFTEWNMWAKDRMQQVSNTSGAFSVIVQGESIKNKYGMAARWDLYNGWENGNDHGLFSDGGVANDPRMNARPSFYHMFFFQKTIGDRLVKSEDKTTGAIPISVKSYASTYSSGEIAVALVNTSGTPQNVELKTENFNAGERFYWYNLAGGTDNGDFSRKVIINGTAPSLETGGPSNYTEIKAKSAKTSGGIKVTIPAWSSIFVMVDKLDD